MFAVGSLLPGLWTSRRLVLGGFLAALASVGLLVGVTWAADGFGDDSGSVHEPAIDALAAEGILEGTECGQGLICPDDPFERWTMAVWLVRALDETPSESEVRFADVDPALWWAPYAERLAELGITSGCATEPARYCPDDPATRGQMATFLVRALDLNPAGPVGFADTGDDTHAANIDALAAAGVTAGCATEPARYCPDDPVTRGQMATFLARALGLVPLPEAPSGGGATPSRAPFTAVSIDAFHSCGLRADGTVDCWGWNIGGSADPPDGRFTSVITGLTNSCGIRVDGTVVCWGSNDSGQSTPPEGRFTSIAAGDSHFCGIRTEGTVACWGSASRGRTLAPDGRFRSVAAGWDHSCGLRTDSTAVCWGGIDGQSDAPGGPFSAITAGNEYTCGLRLDGSVVCWGGDMPSPAGTFSGVVAARYEACGIRMDGTVDCWNSIGVEDGELPGARFTSISSADGYWCGLRTDGTVGCWGGETFGEVVVPEGRFTALASGGLRSCGLRTDGKIACWGFYLIPPAFGYAPDGEYAKIVTGGSAYTCAVGLGGAIRCWGLPWSAGSGLSWEPGRFTAVAVGEDVSCGIRAADLTLDCWGGNSAGSPGGQFKSISAGRYGRFCGLRTDGAAACWRWNRTDDTDVPEGPFSAVSAGFAMSCGIRAADRTLDCWGEDAEREGSQVPEGTFTSISSFDSGRSDLHSGILDNSSTFCGVRTDSSVTCWGANSHALADIPGGPFTSVATGQAHACGLRTGGTASCWGSDERGQSSPPDGHFTTLTAGDDNTCGLRTDGSVTCWGYQAAIPPPEGVEDPVGGIPEAVATEVGFESGRFEDDRLTKATTRNIAYVTAQPDDPAVFVVDVDGSSERRLTDHGQVTGDPAWSPDGSRIAFESGRDGGILVVEPSGWPEERLTRFGGSDPVWSPDGDRIAFTRYFDGGRQVFVMDADGSDERQLTDEGGADPAWSADGERIAFTRYGEVFVMGADGADQVQITTDGGTDPAWSPGGDRIAFTRYFDGGRQVFVMDADGSDERQLTDEGGADPAWSPDGSLIALAGDGGVLVIGVDGTGERRLTRTGGRQPVWSPDGTKVAFAGDGGIFVVDADGSALRQLTVRGGWAPVWSPDGSRLAYSRYIGRDVMVMDRDGSDRRLVAREASDPTWSPDGSRLAFSAAGNVHSVDAHGTDRRQVTRGGGWNPVWSPDGVLIAFTRDGHIFTVSPDGKGERQVTRRKPVAGAPVWSPDSSRLVYASGEDLYVTTTDGSDGWRLTYGGGWDPSWSADSSRIAFTSRVGDLDEVFVVGADGTGLRQLTRGGAWGPSWSPDGSRIAFASRAEVDQSGGIEGIDLVSIVDYIGLINADGDAVVEVVTQSAGRMLVWSPDGTRIMYTSGTSGGLGSIGADGSGRTTLITQGGFSAVWSPISR